MKIFDLFKRKKEYKYSYPIKKIKINGKWWILGAKPTDLQCAECLYLQDISLNNQDIIRNKKGIVKAIKFTFKQEEHADNCSQK